MEIKKRKKKKKQRAPAPKKPPEESQIDKTIADSFPASDPPGWTMGREPKDPAPPGERPSKGNSQTQ